jgi:hypothetical protein
VSKDYRGLMVCIRKQDYGLKLADFHFLKVEKMVATVFGKCLLSDRYSFTHTQKTKRLLSEKLSDATEDTFAYRPAM